MREPVYHELTQEFFATAYYAHADDYTRPMFTFWLGGERHAISLIDLAVRVGIYTREEVASPIFEVFLRQCTRFPPGDTDHFRLWREIGLGEFVPGTNKERRIRSPIIRLAHRLIASSIHHQENSEKVPTQDLFLLWSLIRPRIFLHFPYIIAMYLSSLAVGPRPSSPLCGGHFVTRLATSFGIPLEDMVPHPPRIISRQQMLQMSFLERGLPGGFVVPDDLPAPAQQQQEEEDDPQGEPEPQAAPQVDPQPVAEPAPEERPRRRRRVRSPPHPATADIQPPPPADLQSLSAQVRLLSAQMEWQARTLGILFERLGYPPPPPFPRADDDAGPSGTRADDDE